MVALTKDRQLIGAAGEHLVISRLLSLGNLASLSPRGVERADILVNPLNAGTPLLIQVKTRSGNDKAFKWAMTQKAENISDPNILYCFVNLETTHPDVYVIPSARIAAIVKMHHSDWLKETSKSGKPHKDTKVRTLQYSYKGKVPLAPEGWMDEYLENWSLLSQ
ncbi:hypothetical protein MCEMRE191_00508 [Candidatus Nanopelagicaceae bacterium]